MLSIYDTGDRAWDLQFRQLLPNGHAASNEEITAAFAEGMDWADRHNIDHKRPDSRYYAEQYIRTAARHDPVVPKFMRWYIAHRLGLRCKEHVQTPVPARQPARYIPAHAS